MLESSTPTYFVGIDVALRAEHVAVILDEKQQPVGKKLNFGHTYEDLQSLLRHVRSTLPQQAQAVWGCEATGAGWRPLAAYLSNQGELFSLENAATVAAMRNVDSRHFKTDQIDARTIAETLHRRVFRGAELRTPPPAAVQAQRSLLRRVNVVKEGIGRAKTRTLSVLCDTLLPSLAPTAHSWLGSSLLPVLKHYADPRLIAKKSLKSFVEHGRRLGGSHVPQEALRKLHEAAKQSLLMYGPQGLQWEAYALLLCDGIEELLSLQARLQPLQKELDRLIGQNCPQQVMEYGLSVPGVGEESLQAVLALCGAPAAWPSFKAIKHFAGAVPIVEESGTTSSTPRMSKLGEPLLRKVIYQMGDNARRWDAQVASHYYDQMVNKGKRHVAAAFSAGLMVLNILRAVVREERMYVHRDPQTGEPISKAESRELARSTYRVPEEIRAARRKQKKDSGRKPRANKGHAGAFPKAS
jgi:transposase